MECIYCYSWATMLDLYYYIRLLTPVAVWRRWIIASKLKRPVIYNYVTTWYGFILHTCLVSHCEKKSHRIWPIWKPIPIRFSNLTEFSDNLTAHFRRNKHKSHFVVFITSFLHLNTGFWLFWGSSNLIFVKISQNFIKSPLKICLISRISVHTLWHVWYWQT